MFGLGFGEILVVLLIALVFLGPEKIPETASTLGKWFYELKHSLEDVKSAFEKDFKDKKDKPDSSFAKGNKSSLVNSNSEKSEIPLAQIATSGHEENKNSDNKAL